MQDPFPLGALLTKSLGIPEHQIRMIKPYVGGGFGAHPKRLFPIAALLSKKAGKPVKMVLAREEDFIACRPSVPEIINIRLGVKRDGTMVAKESSIIADSGAYAGICPVALSISAVCPDNVYRIANIKVTADLVYTNKIPRGSYRGFGDPQAAFAMESMVDMAAEALSIDPMEIRLKNSTQPGDITAHGWVINSCGLSESIQRAAEESGWTEKRRDKEKNRGIGMACQAHFSGRRGKHPLYDGSAAVVHVDQYGKVKVVSGESDIGQGASTIFAQIAAEELGVTMNDVAVLPVDSDYSPYALGTLGSRVTVLGGNAVQMAAIDARKQLLKYAAEKLGANADDVANKNKKFYLKKSPEALITLEEVAHYAVFKMGGVPVTGRGTYVVPDSVVMPDKKTQYGNYSLAYSFSTQVAEVTVDPETGKVDVLDVWVGEDIGRALNPKMCQGQLEGGVTQGVGYALSEDYLWHEGRVLNPNFTDYKIPGFTNAPKIHSIFIETNNPETPYSAKSVGESAINPTAPAIANAIYNAVGVRVNELPITPEKVLTALRQKDNLKNRR
jgi:CO/xanthine dehydrogenase Mo-binding subunit